MLKYLKTFCLSLLVGVGLFGVVGFSFPGSASAQIEGGFGDTSYVGKANGGVGVGVYGANTEKPDVKTSLIDTIKKFINWVLGILSLIALILLLWGGFQMLTAAGDEGKFSNGFKILKQAAIALAFIALSWMIVSLIFWVINQAAGTPKP